MTMLFVVCIFYLGYVLARDNNTPKRYKGIAVNPPTLKPPPKPPRGVKGKQERK